MQNFYLSFKIRIMNDIVRKAMAIYEKYKAIYLLHNQGLYSEIKKQDLGDFYEQKDLLDLVYEIEQIEESFRNLDLINDTELISEIENEKSILEIKKQEIIAKLKDIIEKPVKHKEIIIEIRIGTGGVESSLFIEDVYNMYLSVCKRKGFAIEELDLVRNESGGLRRIRFLIKSKEAYSVFKHEAGVHRVQRIPITEANDRIHTSTITVAVMPKADEVRVEIRPEDIRIETCRSSGAGGQKVNKTDSAVRIVHIATNIEVRCQDERSQHKNKDKALKNLHEILLERQNREQQTKMDNARSSQIGSGERNEKIRTYNFGQHRVTDHRIGFSIFNIDSFLKGEEIFDTMIDELNKKIDTDTFQVVLSEDD